MQAFARCHLVGQVHQPYVREFLVMSISRRVRFFAPTTNVEHFIRRQALSDHGFLDSVSSGK